MTLAITLNIFFALVTVAAVVGGHAWVIATQHRAQLRTAAAVVRPRRATHTAATPDFAVPLARGVCGLASAPAGGADGRRPATVGGGAQSSAAHSHVSARW